MSNWQVLGGQARATEAERGDGGQFLPKADRYQLLNGGRTSNYAEIAVIHELESQGWEVHKRGWPDLIALKDGQVRFIEVKPDEDHHLSAAQRRVAAILERYLKIHVEKIVPTQQETQQAPALARSSRKTKSLDLRHLYVDVEWWSTLAKQYPGVDLSAELLKAQDWHGADRVKSPKLFFRNWIERAYRNGRPVFDLPNLDLEEARIG